MNELSLYILDIVQNSIHAKSKLVHLSITEDKNKNLLTIKIDDDGKGMSRETLNRVSDPFYTTRTTRKVGLGIPLFKELCELCEGSLEITSSVGVGTSLKATFKLDSIDLPPFGNMVDTLYVLSVNEEEVDIKYTHEKNGKTFEFDTREIKEILDGVELKEPSITKWFKQYILEGLNLLN